MRHFNKILLEDTLKKLVASTEEAFLRHFNKRYLLRRVSGSGPASTEEAFLRHFNLLLLVQAEKFMLASTEEAFLRHFNFAESLDFSVKLVGFNRGSIFAAFQQQKVSIEDIVGRWLQQRKHFCGISTLPLPPPLPVNLPSLQQRKHFCGISTLELPGC